ncbi:MAG: desulfoferrodoxin [Promethearchaeota archaeon]|nr:MAG: desulfoferrodoxin [Candidatus Lokiarchaeota archaeon]
MNQKEIWKCNVCGKTLEILNPGAPTQICCGQEMQLMEEQTADWKGEKHVPKITIDGNNVTVDVGISINMAHPMTKEHWIMWIELNCKDNCYKRKFLKPGDEPKATFVVASTEGIWAREYCNLHGLWKSS